MHQRKRNLLHRTLSVCYGILLRSLNVQEHKSPLHKSSSFTGPRMVLSRLKLVFIWLYVFLLIQVMLYTYSSTTDCWYFQENDRPGRPVKLNVTKDEWVVVPQQSVDSIYVYSAYLDDRDNTSTKVKILAVGETVTMQRVMCEFYEKLPAGEGRSVGKTKANFVRLKEYYYIGLMNFRFRPYFIECEPPNDTDNITLYVAVNIYCSPSSSEHRNVLKVERTKPQPQTMEHNFVVCVQPLHLNYGNISRQTLQFIEFMEVNTLLGAEKFIVYKESVTPDMDLILQYYVDKQMAVVINWELPFTSRPRYDIHSSAQVSALTDCYYRMMPSSKYVAHLDPDEVLMPLRHNSWNDIMTYVEESSPDDVASVAFENSYFDMHQKHDTSYTNNEALPYPIFSLALTNRLSTTWVSVAKCIGRTVWIDTPEIHSMNALRRGKHVILPTDLALLFHFRHPPSDRAEGIPLRDNSLHKFAPEIKKRVTHVWTAINLQMTGVW